VCYGHLSILCLNCRQQPAAAQYYRNCRKLLAPRGDKCGYAFGMKVHIGCSGYYYRHWQGLWYPADISASRWFSFYAAHFDTLEINASFYRFPTASAVARWRAQAPDGFIYTIKAPRLITHRRRFRNCDAQIAVFYRTLSVLGEKLGCVLFQMPPSLHYTPEALERVLSGLDSGFRNVVEFRHQSWWNDTAISAIAGAGAIFCSVHAPGLPDDIICPDGRIYLRLHGVPWYRQDYSEAELAAWAARIRESRGREIWAYFNNDDQAHAPFNALIFRDMLQGAKAYSRQPQ